MKTPVRHRIAVVALLFAAPAATACSQGFDAQTDQQYQPVNGVTAHLEGVDLLTAAVVAGDDNRGTLVATIVAEEETSLTEVSGDGVTDQGLPVEVAANSPVNLATEGGVEVSGSDVEPGGYVSLTFTFDNGDTTELTVPVVEQSGDYESVPLPAGSTPAPESSEESSEEAAH